MVTVLYRKIKKEGRFVLNGLLLFKISDIWDKLLIFSGERIYSALEHGMRNRTSAIQVSLLLITK